MSSVNYFPFFFFPTLSRGLTDETEILKFLQHGTLVGLLPVPHPILIRKYQANSGTTMWFRTYLWGVIYLRYKLISKTVFPAHLNSWAFVLVRALSSQQRLFDLMFCFQFILLDIIFHLNLKYPIK